MINPSETGSAGEMLRLRTLESVWVQGKLRMWGRWSYIGRARVGSMFNQLLTGRVITPSDISGVLRRMQDAGLSEPELETFFEELLRGKSRSPLAFCTDEEGLAIDRVLGAALLAPGHRGTGRFMTYWWSATACEGVSGRLRMRCTGGSRNGAWQPVAGGLIRG